MLRTFALNNTLKGPASVNGWELCSFIVDYWISVCPHSKLVLKTPTEWREMIVIRYIHQDMSRRVTKPKKWHVRPAKPPGPVWSVFAVRSKDRQGPKLSSCGQRGLWSDWADAQADLSLRRAHMPFCWFCHELAHIAFSPELFRKW